MTTTRMKADANATRRIMTRWFDCKLPAVGGKIGETATAGSISLETGELALALDSENGNSQM